MSVRHIRTNNVEMNPYGLWEVGVEISNSISRRKSSIKSKARGGGEHLTLNIVHMPFVYV